MPAHEGECAARLSQKGGGPVGLGLFCGALLRLLRQAHVLQVAPLLLPRQRCGQLALVEPAHAEGLDERLLAHGAACAAGGAGDEDEAAAAAAEEDAEDAKAQADGNRVALQQLSAARETSAGDDA